MDAHLGLDEVADGFACGCCSEVFTTEEDGKKHIKYVHGHDPDAEEKFPVVFEGTTIGVYAKELGKLICFCGYEIGGAADIDHQAMKDHIKAEHEEEAFKPCPYCGLYPKEVTFHPIDLTKHKRLCSKRPTVLDSVEFEEGLTAAEKLARVPVQDIKITRLNIEKRFFQTRIRNPADATYSKGMTFSFAMHGLGNRPVVVVLDDGDESQGEADLRLRKVDIAPFIEQLTEDQKRDLSGIFAKKLKELGENIQHSDPENPRRRTQLNPNQILWLACTVLDFYMRQDNINDAFLKRISKEDLDWIVSRYIQQNKVMDSLIFELCRSSLVGFTAEEANTKLMKYRGHAILVKPPSLGVSTFFSRRRFNIDAVSQASLEGTIVDNGKEIRHSALHEKWSGGVNIDEFTKQRERGILDRINTFLQDGTFTTHKWGKQIRNFGAPRVVFTSNPKELMNPDVWGQVEFVATVLNTMNYIGDVSDPMSSRLGRVIAGTGLKTIKACDEGEVLPQDSLDRLDFLMEVIERRASGRFTSTYYKMISWLEQPIPSYEKQLDKLLDKLKKIEMDDHHRNKLEKFLSGCKNSYRHVRGEALALSCMDNLHDLLLDRASSEKIQEDADAHLETVWEDNVRSFKEMLSSLDEGYGQLPLEDKLTAIPAYLKGFVLALAWYGHRCEDKEVIKKIKVLDVFEKMTTEYKEKHFGSYTQRSLIDQYLSGRGKQRKIEQKLGELGYPTTIGSGYNFLISNNKQLSIEIVKLLKVEEAFNKENKDEVNPWNL